MTHVLVLSAKSKEELEIKISGYDKPWTLVVCLDRVQSFKWYQEINE